jgi:FdhD protein
MTMKDTVKPPENKFQSTLEAKMVEIGAGSGKPIVRTLAVEAPVALVYNGVSYAVMMVTPQDLEHFVIGFSITEGIVGSAKDILDIEIFEVEAGIIARIDIKKSCFKNLGNKPRNLVGQSSCGLCGVEDLEAALPELKPLEHKFDVKFEDIRKALKNMPERQTLNLETGAMHAAALVDFGGEIITLQEDVGRHSAFDKLIGKITNEGRPTRSGFMLLTSRCSYELVQKAIVARVPMLVAVSAPTSLAVELAVANHLALIALARSDTMLMLNDPFGSFKG